MAQPPPSYTKLFLEEQPPAYNDSVVIKNDDAALAEIVDGTEESNSCAVDIEDNDEKEDASINSDQARTSDGEDSPLNNDSTA